MKNSDFVSIHRLLFAFTGQENNLWLLFVEGMMINVVRIINLQSWRISGFLKSALFILICGGVCQITLWSDW